MKDSFSYTPSTLCMFVLVAMIMTGTLISACDSSGSNDDGNRGALIPLDLENVWRTADGATLRVTDDKREINGESFTRIETNGIEGFLYAREGEGGDIVLNSGELEDDLIEFRLQYPISDGDSYSYTDSEGNSFTVEVSEREVSVPAGSFDGTLCYDVMEAGESVAQACIAPGIGPVRYEGNLYDDLELASYDVD